MKQPTSPQNILPLQKTVRYVWLAWLCYRLLGYPVLIGVATQANIASGIMWQLLVLLPAFLLTPVVLKARAPYLLIVASMLALMYLATVGVFLLIRIYENAPVLVSVGFAVETVLLLLVNWYLFLLLKKLPPMHQTL